MGKLRRVSYRICHTITVFAVLGIAIGLIIPAAAPAAMTMKTMSDMMDIGRYEDKAVCSFSVMDLDNPTQRIERPEFGCGFYWDWTEYQGDLALINEVLWDYEREEVFTVDGLGDKMQEWYLVDGHMLTEGALQFDMEGAGVLMPPPGSEESLIMGWVESGGEKGGEESLVYARELLEIDERVVENVTVKHWASSFERERVTWHGMDVYMTEEVEFDSDPKTGWILDMSRHIVVEMTPTQIATFFGEYMGAPGGVPAATQLDPVLAALTMDQQGMQNIMEFTYTTVDEGQETHVDDTLFFQAMMKPIENWVTIAVAATVVALVSGLLGATLHGLERRAQKAEDE